MSTSAHMKKHAAKIVENQLTSETDLMNVLLSLSGSLFSDDKIGNSTVSKTPITCS